MREVILITVSGEDRPGLTSTLTKALAEYNVDILDVGQAVIHNTLSLGFLVEIPKDAESSPVIKDMLYKAYELNLKMKFQPVSEKDYSDWVNAQGKPRFIITLLGRTITARHIARITEVVADNGMNIDIITRLSGRIPLEQEEKQQRACVEIWSRGTPKDITALRSEFMSISAELGVDIAFQEDNVFRRNRRLVCFDMDSTLIQAEVIDELAKAAGAGEQVATVTESAMRGEIDFKESLRRRLAYLKGLEESVMDEIADSIPLTEGAERLISNLKKVGYSIAILSGGFTYFGRRLQKKLGIDYVFANELEIKDGALTGNVIGEIVDGAKKAELLQKIAEQEGISLQQVIAVGDGANDLPMLNLAGLGIAFHAKPIVKKGAGQAISNLGLDSILYLIGLRDRETLS